MFTLLRLRADVEIRGFSWGRVYVAFGLREGSGFGKFVWRVIDDHGLQPSDDPWVPDGGFSFLRLDEAEVLGSTSPAQAGAWWRPVPARPRRPAEA